MDIYCKPKPGLNQPILLFAIVAVFITVCVLTAQAGQEDNPEIQIEEARKGAVTVSEKGNWVPVPIPVSNPTLGTGLQTVLMYLHSKPAGDSRSPNATSGIAGMYTNTQSWMAGIFHDDYWNDDTYRFTGYLGYGELNLKYYGVGDQPFLSANPIEYEFKMFLVSPKFQIRIPSTEHWFGGLQYLFANSESLFKTSQLHPLLPDIRGRIRTAGLGLLITYDSRDDNYYPTAGQWFEAKWTNYGESWGGDYNYNKLKTFVNHYQFVTHQAVLALRANAEFSSGDAPFIDLPYLDMRGFARGRYQDNMTFSLHAEGRYKFLPRWGLIAFAETGWYGDNFDSLTSSQTIVSYGSGLRWQVTQDKKLNLGLEVAFSGDDSAFYVKVGEAF